MKISMAKLEDVNGLVSLEYDLFRDNAHDRIFFERTTRGGNTHCIITKSGKEVVGYVVYFSKDGQVEILSFGVNPEYQRQGVAKGMFDIILEQDEYKEIWTVLSEYNLVGQLFLKAAGLEYWKTSKDFYTKGVDGYFFRKLKE